MRTGKIDKQKEIEKMRLSFVNHPCKFDCFNDCQRDTVGSYCMLDKVCKWLYNAGYRMESEVRKETAREILNKVYNEIEKARLESEFQDENGKWLIDESEFISEFTLGKLHELYAEYGVEVEE